MLSPLWIVGGVILVGGVAFYVASQNGAPESDARTQFAADNSSQERTAWLGAATALIRGATDVYNAQRQSSGTGSTPATKPVGPAYDDESDWAPDWFSEKAGTTSGTTSKVAA